MTSPRSLALVPLAALLLSCIATGCSASDTGTEDSSEDAVGTRSKFAGVFTSFGRGGSFHEGEIWALETRPDRTFTFHVQGLFGCKKYAGYDCPESWVDGYSGYTLVSGTWASRAGGITLQPTGDGLPADPIRLDMTFTGATLEVQGDIGQRHLTGRLDVRALDGQSHAAKDAALDGSWVVDTALDALGSQPRLDDGSNLYVKGSRHTVTFDLASHGFVERRTPEAAVFGGASFRIAGAPDGQGLGVLVIDNSPHELPHVVPLSAIEQDRLTFAFDVKRGMTMHRETSTESALIDVLAAKNVAMLDSTGITNEEVALQASTYPSSVDFTAALDAALDSFLTDNTDPESPLGLAAEVSADDFCHRVDAKRAVRCFIDSGDAHLGIVQVGETAEHGEGVDANWIFTLSIPKLSDHGHWAVVDRAGKVETFNYGFN